MSPRAQELFRSARLEGPSEEARQRIWSAIEDGVGAGTVGVGLTVVAAKAPASLAPATALTFGMKHVVGALVALVLMGGGAVAWRAAHVSPSASKVPARVPTETDERPRTYRSYGATLPRAEREPARSPVVRPLDQDRLSREAALVLEAKRLLREGEPAAALEILARLRSEGIERQLEPEELEIEQRAERMLGNADRANSLSVEKRLRFGGDPKHGRRPLQ